jgi:hypothetical protein
MRQPICETMARNNRCDIETTELLRDWENQVDDNLDTLADFKAWCRRRGWIADHAETIPRMIVTR